MSVKIQLRREAASVWTSQNPILALGEPGFETDTNQFKIGNGTTAWTSLDYMRQDFVSVVSTSGLAQLTDIQQSGIKEGSLVLTTDGYRWFYTGSGDKTSEAQYVQIADISPDWEQIGSKPASLLSIAGLTTGSGNYIYATASNVYTTGTITTFGRSLVDDADASTARTTLGLGTLATQNGTFSGTNTGDQTAASLGLTIGTNVQAYNTTLAAVASGTYTGTSTITLVGTLSNLTTNDTTVSLVGGSTTISTSGTTAGLTLATNGNVGSASIVIASGLNGNINVNSVGTGNVVLQGNTSGSGANIIVQGASSSANPANIRISPLGTGQIVVGNGAYQANIVSSGNYGLLLAGNSSTAGANILISGASSNPGVNINSVGTGVVVLQGNASASNYGANIRVEGAMGSSSPGNVNINSYYSGNVVLQGNTSGSGANIIVQGGTSSSSNANVTINSLGSGVISLQGGGGSVGYGANVIVEGSSGGNYTPANVFINSYHSGVVLIQGGEGTNGGNIIVRGYAAGYTSAGSIEINGYSQGNVNIKAGTSGGNVLLSGGGGANIRLDGDSSVANIKISPVGTGQILVGNGSYQANIVSSGNYGLLLAGNSSTAGANILISGAGANADIDINSRGLGNINLKSGNTAASARLVVEGISNGNVNIYSGWGGQGRINLMSNVIIVGSGIAQANIVSSGNYGLLLAASSGTGANILIDGTASNANIKISPLGTGVIIVGNGSSQANIFSSGNYPLLLAAMAGTGANILIGYNQANGSNIYISPAGTGVIVVGNGSTQTNIFSSGNYDLLLATNLNMQTGSILIGGTTNSNTTITPAGTGMVVIVGASGLYVQGSIVSASGLYVQGSIVSADGQAPKTLYFNPISGTDLSTTANWYLDKARTLPAGFLPTSQDTVIFQNDSITLAQDATFKSMILLGSSPGTGGSNLTVGTNYKLRSDIYLYDGSYLNGSTGDSNFTSGIIGNVIFRNTSYLSGSGNSHYINGDVTFYDTSKPDSTAYIHANNISWIGASGSNPYPPPSNKYYAQTNTFNSVQNIAGHFVGGNVVVNGNSSLDDSNVWIGGNTTLILNDSCGLPNITFEDDLKSGASTLILNNNPSTYYSSGETITTENPLNIIVNSRASSAGSLLDTMNIISNGGTTITFNQDTYLGSIGGTWQVNKVIFNDTSYNGTALTTHLAIFNDTSHNDNGLACDYAIFNHDSYQNNGPGASIAGSGNATFYNNSENRGTITNGIFHDFSRNISGATISSSGIFYDFSSNAGTISVTGIFPLTGH